MGKKYYMYKNRRFVIDDATGEILELVPPRITAEDEVAILRMAIKDIVQPPPAAGAVLDNGKN